MISALDQEYCDTNQKVIFIGADCIELTLEKLLVRAEQYLDEADVVVGPSTDGGYYLLAIMRQNSESLFEDIDWGSEIVFEQTMNKIYKQNLSYRLLPQLA